MILAGVLLVGLFVALSSTRADAACQTAADCDNGLFCDGLEICDAIAGCQAGVPLALDDGDACTIDECDETTDSIVHRTGPFGVPGSQLPPDQIGQWGAVESWPAQATHAIVVPTGKVLWWRGSSTTQIQLTYLWDPVSSQITSSVPPTGHMLCTGHVTLADGKVLAMGGYAPPNDPPYANVFDPFQETWTRVGDMVYGRYYPTATTLSDGRVIVMSGRRTPTETARIPELYDPRLDTWTPLPQAELLQPLYPNNFLLPDGRVLYADHDSAVLDLDSLAWQPVPTGTAQAGHGSSSVMYRPGVVLRTGHADGVAEVIDMTTAGPQWQPVQSMKYPRELHNMVLLPDGNVLAIGGGLAFKHDPSCAVYEAELWDAQTGAWQPVASMQRPHLYHATAVLLPDGRVLAAGGENLELPLGENTAEIYSPPYLFRGPRPTIEAVPPAVYYGEILRVDTPDADSIATVALVRPGAATHGFDQNQRWVAADFEVGTGFLDVAISADRDILPPGYYMLFLIDSAGVPSVSEFVRVEEDTSDVDADGVFDGLDNCADVANPAQENRDADALGDACDLCPDYSTTDNDDFNGNGIGDPCECGDQTQDGVVDVTDLIAIDAAIFGLVPMSPLCDANDDGACNVSDIVAANQKIFGRPAYCSRYPPPGP